MLKVSQEKVLIVGAGVIGLGWAKRFSQAGWITVITDTDPHASEKIKEQFPDGSVSFVPDLTEAAKDVDFVQENAPERLDIKKSIFATLAEVTPSHTILASSSSSIVSSKFTEDNPAANRILIGHPFNPVDIMPLVEVVPHPGTGENIIKKAVEVYTDLGQEPIVIHKEIGGFAGNRLQVAFNNEARYLVQQGVVTVGDLDRLVKASLGLRWATVGPFEGQHLGGGPGGIAHLYENVGKGLDIKLEAPSASPNEAEKLVKAVEKEYGTGAANWKKRSEKRDHLAEGIIKLRAAENN